MFFIGATGQLLTLILTVSLPLMMVFSGHQKVEIQTSKQNIEFEQISNLDISFENFSVSQGSDFFAEIQKLPVYFENNLVFRHLPKKIKVKWKTFCLSNSGNKAPPVLY